MQFDANTRTLTTEFPMSAALTHKEIKGNASFADGITVQTFAKMGGNTSYDWSSKGIRVVLQKTQADGSVRPVTKEVIFQSREFYKVFPFSKDYQ